MRISDDQPALPLPARDEMTCTGPEVFAFEYQPLHSLFGGSMFAGRAAIDFISVKRT